MTSHYSDYDPKTTESCERTLVTLVGDLGPWGARITLIGGLAPRYIVGTLPAGVRHMGTNDVDVVLQLFLESHEWEAYKTLETNIRRSGFEPGESSYQWTRKVEGVDVVLEFICETNDSKRETLSARLTSHLLRLLRVTQQRMRSLPNELAAESAKLGFVSPTSCRS